MRRGRNNWNYLNNMNREGSRVRSNGSWSCCWLRSRFWRRGGCCCCCGRQFSGGSRGSGSWGSWNRFRNKWDRFRKRDNLNNGGNYWCFNSRSSSLNGDSLNVGTGNRERADILLELRSSLYVGRIGRSSNVLG
jgi:hypothetical protein